MDAAILKERTKQFALRVIKLVAALPQTSLGKVLGNQLLRSGTSVAANYRAACCARTHVEFTSKLGIVAEEADETCFWLEMITDTGILRKSLVEPLLAEAKEITAIMVSSRKSASKNTTTRQ